MPFADYSRIAADRLRAAGVPEDEIPALLERAIALVEGLAGLAALDPQLPEPALIWRPVDEVPA
jgi:hypothetical protein